MIILFTTLTLLSIWCLSLNLRLLEQEKQLKKVFTGIQQGDTNRKWKGYWKIKPEDHQAIYQDPRTCSEIAKDYNVSPSHISQIKRNYKNKINL